MPDDPEEIVSGIKCLDYEIPWVVPEAIYKLDEELKEDDSVLEFGSGGSTLFFINRCSKVISVETTLDWIYKVWKFIGTRRYVYFKYLYYTNPVEAINDHYVVKFNPTVLFVDLEGNFNRSEILNEFFKNGVPASLRMLILDNYAHEGIFPDHYNRIIAMGYGWERFEYNHPRWAGNGTMIYLKTK